MADTEFVEMFPNQHLGESTSTGAIIDCEVTKDKENKYQRMSMVWGVNSATEEQIHHAPALIGPPYIYPNSKRSSILNSVEAIENVAAKQRAEAWEEKFQKSHTEFEEKFRKEIQKLRKDFEQRSQVYDSGMGELQESIKEFQGWLATIVTGLLLSNENTIGPAVGLLSLVLREASEGCSAQEIIVEGQIGTKDRHSTKCILRMSVC